MNADNKWDRYSCQLTLPGFGKIAQDKLNTASVLIIGAGGLGCPVAQYLTGVGVGTIGIADFDTVSTTNLHRQILYGPADFGKNKAETACSRLQQQNPDVRFHPYPEKITANNALDIFNNYDIIIDCTDNFDTRYLVNDASVLCGKPLVYGAIYQYEGQVAVLNAELPNGLRSPNYRDLFPKVNALLIPDCAEGGVIPTLAGIIGTIMANETIKLITGIGEPLIAKLLLFDAQTLLSRIVKMAAVSQVIISRLPRPAVEADTISKVELDERLKQGDVDLIDVRTAEEREQFNIGGRHIPLHELESKLDSLSPDKPSVFYCATGKRSAQAAQMVSLKLPGSLAVSLEGGIKEWMDING